MTNLSPKNEVSKTPANGTTRAEFITPPANIHEDKDGYVLQAEMPGVSKDNLEITVENGELIIVGRRSRTHPAGEWIHRESRQVDYRRVFELDPSIDTNRVTAKVEQGVLTLHLPKAEALKPRLIPVTD